MVGPWGLEPQTSTVSIRLAMWEVMRRSEYKLHNQNALRELLTVKSCEQ